MRVLALPTIASVMTVGVLAAMATPAAASPPSATVAALAPQINLAASDLPGWSPTPYRPPGPKAVAINDRIDACIGAPNSSATGHAQQGSPTFLSQGTDVGSTMGMDETVKQVTEALSAQQGPKLLTCVWEIAEPYLRASLQGAGYTVTGDEVVRTSVAEMPPASYGYRIGFTMKYEGRPTSIISDMIGFAVGRAEFTLTVTRLGGLPNKALEQRLVTLLEQRADAHRARLG